MRTITAWAAAMAETENNFVSEIELRREEEHTEDQGELHVERRIFLDYDTAAGGTYFITTSYQDNFKHILHYIIQNIL